MIDSQLYLRLLFAAMQATVALCLLYCLPFFFSEKAVGLETPGTAFMAYRSNGIRVSLAPTERSRTVFIPVLFAPSLNAFLCTGKVFFSMAILPAYFSLIAARSIGLVVLGSTFNNLSLVGLIIDFAAQIMAGLAIAGKAVRGLFVLAKIRSGFGLPALGAAFFSYNNHVNSPYRVLAVPGAIHVAPRLCCASIIPQLQHVPTC